MTKAQLHESQVPLHRVPETRSCEGRSVPIDLRPTFVGFFGAQASEEAPIDTHTKCGSQRIIQSITGTPFCWRGMSFVTHGLMDS